MRKKIAAALLPAALLIWPVACTVEQTEEGELPEVEGGQLPEYDVDPARVDIDTDTKKVVVPDIDITRDTTDNDTSR